MGSTNSQDVLPSALSPRYKKTRPAGGVSKLIITRGGGHGETGRRRRGDMARVRRGDKKPRLMAGWAGVGVCGIGHPQGESPTMGGGRNQRNRPDGRRAPTRGAPTRVDVGRGHDESRPGNGLKVRNY